MATRKKATKSKAEVKASAKPVKSEKVSFADELVAQASINATIEEEIPAKVEKPKAREVSSFVTVLNTSFNEILLNTGVVGEFVRIAPKEMKRIERSTYRDLMKNQVVRNWFDKGILSSSEDANETSVHEAEVPENLKGAVEKTDSVSTVSASVTKFEKEGTVQIKL